MIDPEELQAITFRAPAFLVRNFKLFCITHGEKISEILSSLIKEFLERDNKDEEGSK